MAVRLSARDADFEERFTALLATKREQAEYVDAAVREIIRTVREGGDAALCDYTSRLDHFDIGDALRVSPAEIAAAVKSVPSDQFEALAFAAQRITDHHRRQIPSDDRYTDATGAELGHRWTPVDAVGLYVPGGMASYPSSVLMNAIPAKVAGVPRLVITVPAPRGVLNPMVLAAAHIAGVEEIYRVGGAQAIAALAYGTKTIAPVAKIVGPGNTYVAAAKRQVFGTVGIDMIAGPSEVLIVADASCNPQWIAADLLAQAEHDEAAQAILITDNAAFADAVSAAVEMQLATLPRSATAAASWRDFGAIILVERFAESPGLVNRLAPEHLELQTTEPENLVTEIRHAGAIFIGRFTPEAIGDYVAGSNHVLPTARSARFSSGLGVLDFMKRTSILRLTEKSLAALGPAAMTLASVEGLDAHRRSIAIRLAEEEGVQQDERPGGPADVGVKA
jgi:histidinol dehydrogenase